jgi:hypothetical protein
MNSKILDLSDAVEAAEKTVQGFRGIRVIRVETDTIEICQAKVVRTRPRVREKTTIVHLCGDEEVKLVPLGD